MALEGLSVMPGVLVVLWGVGGFMLTALRRD